MISLKDACKKVLSEHPGKYIHVVNEYDEVYAFILMNDGEQVTETTGILVPTTVYKETGEMTDDLWLYEDVFQGDYKQYTRQDIERL